jgi:hypothetical protein
MVATDGRRWLSVDRLGAKPEAVLRGASRQVVEASALHTEPYRSDLGDVGSLIAAAQRGLRLIPPAAVIIPGKGFTVIGGERRTAALLQAGARSITLYTVRTWREFLAWMLLDEQLAPKGEELTAGRVDWPMSLVDAAYWTRKVLANLKTTRFDGADQAMAEHIGREHERIREVRYALHWLDNPDEAVRAYAAEQLKLVAQGVVSGGTIGGRITKFAERRNTMPIAQQRRTLTSAAAQCAGLADALRPLVPALSDELADDEIDSTIGHLIEGRLQLERVIRALKTIKKERSA